MFGIGLRGVGLGGPRLVGGGGADWTPAYETTVDSALPYAWYNAAAVPGVGDGDDVVTWLDSGAGGRNGTQANASKRAAWISAGRAGRPALRFAGEDCYVVPLINASTSHTFFAAILGQTIVGSYLFDTSPTRTILAMRDNAGFADSVAFYDGTWRRLAPAFNGWQIVRWRFDGANNIGQIWVNGYLMGSAAYSPRTLQPQTVLGNAAAEAGLPILTDIGEFLYYASCLSDIDCVEVESYLARTYRLNIAGNGNYGNAASPAALPGVWTWFANPRAVHYSGERNQTYLGVMDGDNATIHAINHDNGRMESFVLRYNFSFDDHNNPSILIRASDKRVMCFYSAHNGPTIYLRVSATPEDVTAWRKEVYLDTSIGLNLYAYPCPVQLTGEASEPIYLFFRAYPSTFYSVSTDDGATWSAGVELFDNGVQRPYFHLVRNGTDRIDFVVTDGHPNEVTTNSIYHCYYQGGNLYKTDGTFIGPIGGGPYTPATHLTKVYDGATYPGWNYDIAVDGSGYPVIAYAQLRSSSDHRYRYARWSGTNWIDNEIVAGGGHIADEVTYSGGIHLDHANPDIVYVSREVSGQWEIWKYTTTNDGVSWEGVALTSGSSQPNLRPVVPRDASSSLPVVWFSGTYTTYTDYDAVLRGEPNYF